MNRSDVRKIGGSNIAALLGVSKWQSPHSLYLHLTGELPPEENNEERNAIFARGHALEPVIADWFAKNHPEFLVETAGMYIDEECPFLIASPDRLLLPILPENEETEAGLEIKSADINTIGNWGEEGTEEIPVEYLCQCQWYCGLLGYTEWHLAVGFVKSGRRMPYVYREYIVKHSSERFNAMKRHAIDFWTHHVLANVPPEITKPDADTIRYYRNKYPMSAQDKTVFCNDEMSQIIADVKDAQERQREADKAFETAKLKLIARMGDAEAVIDPVNNKRLITYKGFTSSGVDYKSLVAAMGITDTQLLPYKRETSARRFIVTKN